MEKERHSWQTKVGQMESSIADLTSQITKMTQHLQKEKTRNDTLNTRIESLEHSLHQEKAEKETLKLQQLNAQKQAVNLEQMNVQKEAYDQLYIQLEKLKETIAFQCEERLGLLTSIERLQKVAPAAEQYRKS